METKNAIIKSTQLGPEDHGIFTAYLQLDYGGACQSFGGYAMKGATGYGIRKLDDLLKCVGVSSWENLPGKHVRVVRVDGIAKKIGHIIEDKWFDWEPDEQDIP